MQILRLFSLGILFVFLYQPLSAQTPIKRPFSNWFMLHTAVDMNEKLSLGLELHLRREDWVKNCFQQVIRPSVRYKIDEHIQIGGGYSFLTSHPVQPIPLPGQTHEHNVWEELSFHHHLGKYLHIVHRYRLEQRFIDHWHEGHGEWAKSGRRYENTLRYKFKVLFPLTHFDSHRDIYIKLFDDIWLTEQSNLLPSAFYENKFFIGLGWKFTETGSVELGYMNVYYDAHDLEHHFISTDIMSLAVHYRFNSHVKNPKKDHPCTTH